MDTSITFDPASPTTSSHFSATQQIILHRIYVKNSTFETARPRKVEMRIDIKNLIREKVT